MAPRGLESLVGASHIFVEQRVEGMEFLFGNNAANEYKVKDQNGQVILVAEEHSNTFARLLIGQSRSFELKLLTNTGEEIMTSNRRYKCAILGCCFDRCNEQMLIHSRGQQEFYGSITQSMKCGSGAKFAVLDEHGDVVFHIRPPQKLIIFNQDGWVFDILDASGKNSIGEIRKKWKGLMSEMFTSADNFGVSFPVDLDVKYKAMLINACILVVSKAPR